MSGLTPCYIWQDLPDNDVVRVDDTYYMVSTSMHSMPGCPIVRSKDLMHWELISYVFTTLEDNAAHRLEDGCGVYGQGSWAASLKYADGRFYCLFNSQDMHHAYIYSTGDPCRTGWERHELPAYMHDPALLMDDDGHRYVVYGNGEIRITELTHDMTALKPVSEGGFDRPLLSGDTEGIMLRCEGCHAYRIGGYYYLIFIEWPKTGHFRRREICYRSASLFGPYEHRVILDEDFGYHNAGVAQGAIFDRPDGSWAVCMFQDHGAVGRIPYLLNMHWKDDWPVIETDVQPVAAPCITSDCHAVEEAVLSHSDGGQSAVSDTPAGSQARSHISGLLSFAQWNHAPELSAVTVRDDGGIILRAVPAADVFKSRSDTTVAQPQHRPLLPMGILTARNTLTWRTHGPRCSIAAALDLSQLAPGERAGLAAMQGQFGLVGVRIPAASKAADCREPAPQLVMCLNDGAYGEQIVESLPVPHLADSRLRLRIDFNFEDNIDVADFFWSADGSEWHRIGETLHMRFTLDLFMGCRMGIYCYGTDSGATAPGSAVFSQLTLS